MDHRRTLRAARSIRICLAGYALRATDSSSLAIQGCAANTAQGRGFPCAKARGFSSVKGLRVHARMFFPSSAFDVATGGNAK